MQRQSLAKGVGTGLQLWLIFLLGLFWLGYSAPISIGLGAIAALAGGVIANWLQSKDEEKKSVEPAIVADIQIPEDRDYRTSSLKKFALRRERQRKLAKQLTNWKFWQAGRKSS